MKSFVAYRSFADAIRTLPVEEQLKCHDMIYDYALDGIEPSPEDGIVYTLFLAFKPQIDANSKKRSDGYKGGRPKKEDEKPKENEVIEEETIGYEDENHRLLDEEPNVNVNANANVNDNVNKKENIKEKRNEDISSVVSYLNDHASTHYRSSSRNTRSHINARFEDGYTVEDFKQVIDTKCDEWLGTDMAKYLRPDTLFGAKFESYLNQKPRAKPQAPNYSIDNSNLGITEEDIERYLK